MGSLLFCLLVMVNLDIYNWIVIVTNKLILVNEEVEIVEPHSVSGI